MCLPVVIAITRSNHRTISCYTTVITTVAVNALCLRVHNNFRENRTLARSRSIKRVMTRRLFRFINSRTRRCRLVQCSKRWKKKTKETFRNATIYGHLIRINVRRYRCLCTLSQRTERLIKTSGLVKFFQLIFYFPGTPYERTIYDSRTTAAQTNLPLENTVSEL